MKISSATRALLLRPDFRSDVIPRLDSPSLRSLRIHVVIVSAAQDGGRLAAFRDVERHEVRAARRAFRRRLDDDVRDEVPGERRAGPILVGLCSKLRKLGRTLGLRAEAAV